MSSFDKSFSATPWSLDEFASQDIFASIATSALPAAHVSHSARPEPALSIEEIEQAAYDRGVQDGHRRAQASSEARVSGLVVAVDEAVEHIRVHQARWLSNIDENIAALAVAVASQIVQREVSTDAVVVQSLVRQALAQFPLDETITVRLNPDDHALCSAPRSIVPATREHDVRWIADPNVQRGGCLVEGRERIIDGRVDTALERFYRAIGQVQA